MQDDNAIDARPRHRRGNRALLAAGLGAAVAAVASLVALSGAGAAPAAVSAAPAAQAQPLATSQAGTQTANRTAAEPAAAPAAARAPMADHTVAIKNYAFAPAALTITAGQSVTWTNEDTAPHTVTTSSGPAAISSPNLAKGQSFTYTFTKAGTYKYYCAVHPDMTATITVTAGSGGSGGTASGGTSGGTASGGTTGGTSGGGSMGGMSGGTTAGGAGTTGGSGGAGGSGGSGEECYSVQQVLMPILQHINSAHLGESVGQQVQDALALDSYLKLHTVWLESIITPAANAGTSILDQTLTTLVQHLDSAHLEEPLGQQVQDILNPAQYVSSHLVLAEHLLAPTESYLTSSC